MKLTPTDIEKAIEHLQAALAVLQADEEESPRNPEHFRDTGHLTDKGIEHLHSLFAAGKTVYAAAKEMDISYRAAAVRHAVWSQKAKS